MSKNRKKIKREAYKLPIHQSLEFYKIADNFLSEMGGGIKEAGETAFKKQPELFAIATNLALALELALKGISIYSKSEILLSHEVDSLFKDLDKEIRDSIEAIYENKRAATPKEKNIRIHLTDESKKSPDDVKPVKGFSIYDVLRRNKDHFITFRYIFETLVQKEFTILFEFTNLQLIFISILTYCKDNGIKY